MTTILDLPLWAAVPVCLLLLAGALISFVGALGLIRLRSFYERIHAPTLATSGGVVLIALASMLTFLVLQSRFILHEVLIILFVVLTTPVSLTLLSQAALYRDRAEGSTEVPRKAHTAEADVDIDPDAAT
ncbi:monovalent cation/H(+) antiporter subunit G [Rhizobium sp. CC-YZS058]|uniref:monovalent cation/H(+) antiporter subunit G n=1 Tax=Rhizobium sp. CC-YZS058 TaxID=3042153 RepID=UPI002B0577ED|nr:monovalent cation/H(+) antiporter subunit G [Rhizobium sp. CC-YZS058]MEA3533496.1 monovalent cation/H(+) antiporter subunit G [Rhizobium sp. CC-YZS058]